MLPQCVRDSASAVMSGCYGDAGEAGKLPCDDDAWGIKHVITGTGASLNQKYIKLENKSERLEKFREDALTVIM